MDTIKAILISRGYNEASAALLEKKLSSIDPSLNELLEDWLMNETEGDITISGLSLIELMNKFHMKYLAALLSIDWLIREPEKARVAIEQGIK